MSNLTGGFESTSAVDGADISTSDAGDADAWDVASHGTGGTSAYDAANAYSGGFCGKFQLGATSTICRVEWSSTHFSALTDHYGRCYLKHPVNKVLQMIRFRNVATLQCAIQVSALGKLQLVDAAGTVQATSGTTLPSNAYYRLEYHVVHSATVGSMSVDVYTSPESLTPAFTLTATNINTGTTCNDVQFGIANPTVTTGPIYIDQIVAHATAAVGPLASGTKNIVPAAVSSSSGMTGSVLRLHPSISAAPSASSSVTANIVERHTFAFTMSASSDVSGSIVALRSIIPGSISASSTLSASIVFRFPFPIASVIDSFNRAGPLLGANWTSPFFGSVGVHIVSNQAESENTGSAGNALWSAGQFGPDCEVYATIAAQPLNGSDHPRLFIRVNNPGSNLNGYRIDRSYNSGGTDVVTVNRHDAGVLTPLATFNQDFNVGDKIGVRAAGSIISVYRYDVSAGTWTRIGQVSDSTYTAAGYVGFQASLANSGHTQATLDDFAAGTVAAAISISAGITSSSGMTGSISRLKRFTFAITASSAVVGSIAGIRRLVSSITATSAVSGAVSRIRRLIPAPISSTSLISAGLFGTARNIAVASITATSTVTISGLPKVRFVTIGVDSLKATSDVVVLGSPPITMVATSNVSGHIRRTTKIPVSLTATSAVTASVGRFISQIRSVNIVATSPVTVFFSQTKHLTASMGSLSDITASLGAVRTIRPTITATSSVTARVAAVRPFAASITSTSTVVGALARVHQFFPVLTATSPVVASVVRVRRMASSISSTSAVTAGLVAQRRITGAITATSTVFASVSRQGAVNPVLFSTSTVTASVVRVRAFSAPITATSTVAAGVVRQRGFFPVAVATSNVVYSSLAAQRGIFATMTANSSVTTMKIRAERAIRATLLATSTVTARIGFTRAFAPTMVATSYVTVGASVIAIHLVSYSPITTGKIARPSHGRIR